MTEMTGQDLYNMVTILQIILLNCENYYKHFREKLKVENAFKNSSVRAGISTCINIFF